MSLHAGDIAGREFVVTQDGYDREEVRAFLEVVARNQQALQDELAALRRQQAAGTDVGSEIAEVLQNARAAADDALRLANEEAEAIRARAEADADRLRQATIESSDRAREEADLYAFETRARADRETRERIRATNEKIEALLAAAARVRERLVSVDATLATVRSEVVLAVDSLDREEVAIEQAAVPPPPPPPAVVDLTEEPAGNGTRIGSEG